MFKKDVEHKQIPFITDIAVVQVWRTASLAT